MCSFCINKQKHLVLISGNSKTDYVSMHLKVTLSNSPNLISKKTALMDWIMHLARFCDGLDV